MKSRIKENKLQLFFLLPVFCIFVFCHFQTFIINDDLPYSLFYRANDRIANIGQIISNQFFDYSHISARVFIHSVVQFLLIFDKNLWSILNPLMIILIISLMSYIVYILTNKKTKPIYIVIASTISFLLLFDFKYLIYWVAGSVNYVWVFLIILLVLLYYIKFGLLEKPICTFLICLFASIICESLAILLMVIIVFDALINVVCKKLSKKDFLKYFMFLIGALIGFSFLFFAPSTVDRMGSGVETWDELSLFSKILTAIPVLSDKMFSIGSIYNLFPLFVILSIIYRMRKEKNKGILIFIALAFTFSLIGLITKNGYSFFLLSILILVFQSLIFIKHKDYRLIVILISAYALTFSLAITPEYTAGRTCFHTSLILALFIMYNFMYNNELSKILKIIFICLVVVLLIIEIIIYSYIGIVKRDREESIKKVQSGKTDVLITKIIKSPFDKFHIDANNPVDKNYWAYAAFEDYYNLNENIRIEISK